MSNPLMNVPMETRQQFFREAATYWPIEQQEILLRMMEGDSTWVAARTVHQRMNDGRSLESYQYHGRRVEDAFRLWLDRGTDLDILRRDGIVRGMTKSRARELIAIAEQEGIVAKMDLVVYRVD